MTELADLLAAARRVTTFTGAGGSRFERGDYFAFDIGGEPLVWNPEQGDLDGGEGSHEALEFRLERVPCPSATQAP